MSLFTNWLESLSYDLEAADHCLRKTSPFSSCTACIDNCPEQAIQGEKGTLTIDHNRCNGCGRCITLCPVQALMGESPRRQTLNGMLIFDDGPLPTINELFYLYKRGIRSVYVKTEGEGLTELKRVIEEVNSPLVKMGKEPISIASELVMTTPERKVSRRDFFTNVTSSSKKLALSTAAPAKWRFNQEQFKVTEMFEGWSLYSVEINSSCTLCETCFKLCPSNVFALTDGQLEIHGEKCSGCMLCVDVCMDKGILMNQEVKEAQPVIMNVEHNTCKRCHSSFTSREKEENCPICKKRANLNFLF
ncbi:MAG: 4Fe-4S dicluster domain-containing protein [Bacillota bacterium]